MKNHIMVNSKCLKTNKCWNDLSQKQKEKISGWIYESFEAHYSDNISAKKIRCLILSDVLFKINCKEINIPASVIHQRVCAIYRHLLKRHSDKI